MAQQDDAIRGTADDAWVTKRAAVEAGYYDDPFLLGFASTSSATTRRVEPLIKRGTHARVCCMDRALTTFLQLNHDSYDGEFTRKNVVILGAGKDTSFFRWTQGLLMAATTTTSSATPSSSSSRRKNNYKVAWYEVDHPCLVRNKATTVQRQSDVFCDAQVKSLHAANGGEDKDATYLYQISTSSSTECYYVGHDLRQQGLLHKLRLANLDPSLPTLFVLECVQMYLPESDSRSLLQSLATDFSQAFFCGYEPLLGQDAFGRVMEQHLTKAKGVCNASSTMAHVRTLDLWIAKLQATGWTAAVTGCSMVLAYETVVTASQRQRAQQCEMLDEVEEWMMLMGHYGFVVAANTTSSATAAATTFCNVAKSWRDTSSSPMGFVQGKCVTTTMQRS